jgi:REP element-mobilizing transposase RayT
MPTRASYRRTNRLPDFDYIGPLAAHLIFVTRRREPLFTDPDLAALVLDAIRTISERFKTTLHAYCLMPDHVHLLIEVADGISMKEYVRILKQTSGFALKQRVGEEAWQVSYYDHILRKEEALQDVAAYIWSNPVEAGLVGHPRDYDLSGPRDAVVAL